MHADTAALLRSLPKIDAIVSRADVRGLAVPHWAVVEAARREVADLRGQILAGQVPDQEALAIPLAVIEHRVAALTAPSLRRVINATGVVLHTNLGRAPLAEPVIDRILHMGRGYTNLEYDLDQGGRGSRHHHLTALITALTGAADAAVVNNNAAAVMLGLAALATDCEVIVSRGELIEIGGSFRIPDVMRLSGAHLVEVGTTNKTRPADVRAAITERTGLLLKVHRSNFAVVGFCEEVSAAELAEIGRESSVATMMDLGSGSFIDAAELRAMGLGHESTVTDVIAAGVDLVTFSGDKLLGGPQAGILCGRRDLIERVRRHPLMRALRPDKLTLTALEATLQLYRDGRPLDVPAVAMLAEPAEAVRDRAEAMLHRVGPAIAGQAVSVEVISCESTVGGGAMPLSRLPSWGLALWPHARNRTADITAKTLERSLRSAATPVIGRIVDERLILDMRTVSESEMDALAAVLGDLGVPRASAASTATRTQGTAAGDGGPEYG